MQNLTEQQQIDLKLMAWLSQLDSKMEEKVCAELIHRNGDNYLKSVYFIDKYHELGDPCKLYLERVKKNSLFKEPEEIFLFSNEKQQEAFKGKKTSLDLELVESLFNLLKEKLNKAEKYAEVEYGSSVPGVSLVNAEGYIFIKPDKDGFCVRTEYKALAPVQYRLETRL